MRRVVSLNVLLLLCMASLAMAQETRFITEYRLDRDVVEIPFELVQNQILVKGRVDDKTELTFLFDTGASAPVLDKNLGVNGTRVRDAVIQEAEGATAGEMIWVSRFNLGGTAGQADVYNVATLVTDLSQMSRLLNRKVDGILGITFMAGYVVEIDYEKKTLQFANPQRYTIASRKPDNQRTFLLDLKPANGKSPFSVFLASGKLHSKYDYSFLLDTGFGGYLSVGRAAAIESGLLKEETPRVTTLSYSVSRQFVTMKFRANFLMLGEINLSGRVIAADIRNGDAYGQTGILGNALLKNYRITLDCPRKKLWMERVTDKEELDIAEKPALGLAIRANGKTILVDKVSKNSPAANAGVRAGDEIVTINGTDTERMTTVQVLNLLASPKGSMTLNLRRENGSVTALSLEPLSPLDWKAGR